MTIKNSLGVLLCTYRRPNDLGRCLDGLALQTQMPDDVIVVVRESDQVTLSFLQSRERGALPVRIVTVNQPGLVAARNAGLAACSTDILAMIDDDAVPRQDWVERILTHFTQFPRLGGLGGRDRCFNGTSFDDREHPVVGKLHWFGRRTGHHHIGVGPIREVDVLKGANMCYRAAAIAGLQFDTRLRGSGAQPYEDIAFCLAVRREGWQLMYDPQVLVDHYEGPRDEPRYYGATIPVSDAKGFRNFAYNGAVAFWEEFSLVRRFVFLLWSLLVGTRVCPGLVQAIRFTPSMGWGSWYRFHLAQQGICSAYAHLMWRRKPQPRRQGLAS
jgi:GT2 family glycosyltransferase